MIRALAISVVPSPYQRDVFRALAARPEIELDVRYMEADLKGYPWPQEPLAHYEKVLPGSRIDTGKFRVHLNWKLPNIGHYDVVVFNTYLTSITAQWAMRRCPTKWLFWGERLRPQPTRPRRIVQEMFARVLRRPSGIAAIGKLAAADYASRFPAVSIVNIPYHCSLHKFARFTGDGHCEQGRLAFLYCGIMNERKGVDLLLKAFERLVSLGRDAELILVGQEAELPRLLKNISAAARSRVRFEGFQPPDRLPQFFKQAAVFVLPSRYDGWGVVMNQALGSGLALIGSDAAGASHDLIHPGRNGLMFQAGNADELFRCMEVLANNPDKCVEWGSRSRAMASEWTPDAGAAKWVGVLERVIGRACQEPAL